MRTAALWVACCLVLGWTSQARAGEEVVAILARGDVEQSALADVREGLAASLRDAGHAILATPGQAFENRHSRPVRTLDRARLQGWAEELVTWRNKGRHDRVAGLATRLVHELASVPEVRVQDAASLACFEGTIAYQAMGRLEEARDIVEFCAGLAWLVTRDDYVEPNARAVLLRDVQSYELVASVAPSTRRLELQGVEIKSGTTAIRTRPGTRLAVTADCSGVQRVHWVDAEASARTLRVDIDCEFDEAIHTLGDRLSLWSPPEFLTDHARRIGKVLGTPTLIVAGKRGERYELRRVFVEERPGATVSLPVVHTDRDVARAMELLLENPTPAAKQAATVPAPPAPRVNRPAWLSWTGGTALALGLGGELAAWLLYRDRVEKGGELQAQLSARSGTWEAARAPMLGVGAAGAGLAAAGVALLAMGTRKGKVPWWLIGTSGAAGVGLATWGAVDLTKGDGCGGDVRKCVDSEQQRDRGALLLMSAVPLLVLPVATLVGSSRPESAVRVAATAQGLQIHRSW